MTIELNNPLMTAENIAITTSVFGQLEPKQRASVIGALRKRLPEITDDKDAEKFLIMHHGALVNALITPQHLDGPWANKFVSLRDSLIDAEDAGKLPGYKQRT